MNVGERAQVVISRSFLKYISLALCVRLIFDESSFNVRFYTSFDEPIMGQISCKCSPIIEIGRYVAKPSVGKLKLTQDE